MSRGDNKQRIIDRRDQPAPQDKDSDALPVQRESVKRKGECNRRRDETADCKHGDHVEVATPTQNDRKYRNRDGTSHAKADAFNAASRQMAHDHQCNPNDSTDHGDPGYLLDALPQCHPGHQGGENGNGCQREHDIGDR